MSLGFMYFGPGAASNEHVEVKHPPPNEGIAAWRAMVNSGPVPATTDAAGIQRFIDAFQAWVSSARPSRQVALDSAQIVASNLVRRWFWQKPGEDLAYASAVLPFLQAADRGLAAPGPMRGGWTAPARTFKVSESPSVAPLTTQGSDMPTSVKVALGGAALVAAWAVYAKMTGRRFLPW